MPICDRCGKDLPDVEEYEDPYSKEINDEIVIRALCRDCYQERLDDI
jgi:hypothetical protein